MSKRYRKYPYKERRQLADGAFGNWYAYYRENDIKKKVSLDTRNTRIAEKRFLELLERLDKGILGFSPKPRPLRFTDFAHTFLREGTDHLSEASALRHRQNLFGLEKDKEHPGQYVEKKGHLVVYFRGHDFKSIRVGDINKYISRRRGSNATANTIHKELATLSAMFRFAMSRELVLFNPVLVARKPKIRLVRPSYVPSEEEIFRILEQLHPSAARFCLAFLNSGCRKSELVACDVVDADLQQKGLHVVGKGDKQRKVFMNSVLHECIVAELSSRLDAKPDEPLFLNREKKRYRSLRTPLTTACQRAGVPRISHHSLRHAYATLQYERGLDIVRLSKLLGHASLTITQNIYVNAREERLREAADSR